MKPFHAFINLMTKVLDFLPRYLVLSEKNSLSAEEEIELDDITDKIESCKSELLELMPELNKSLTEDMINSYYDALQMTDKSPSRASVDSAKFSEVFKIPVDDWLRVSQN